MHSKDYLLFFRKLPTLKLFSSTFKHYEDQSKVFSAYRKGFFKWISDNQNTVIAIHCTKFEQKKKCSKAKHKERSRLMFQYLNVRTNC